MPMKTTFSVAFFGMFHDARRTNRGVHLHICSCNLLLQMSRYREPDVILSFHLIKHSPYLKIFQVNIVNFNTLYI
jgi:hypothetical protein